MRETNFTSSSKCPEFSSTWYATRRYSAILRLLVSQFRRLRRAIHRNATEKDKTDREEAGNRWFAILKLLTGQCRLSLRVFSDFGLFGEPPSECEKI